VVAFPAGRASLGVASTVVSSQHAFVMVADRNEMDSIRND